MKVLVINAGSSSLKYQLMDMSNEHVLAKGLCERIGVDGRISHKTADGVKVEYDVSFPTHKEAFMELVKVMSSGEGKVIDSMSEISAIGHRVLHGSEKYKVSTVVTDTVIDDIMAFKDLGPLHNPPQAIAMKACQEVFGKDTPMVAVFDTSFHQTMPPKAYMFGVPYEYYEKYSIRRYGFHGTSHRYIAHRLGELKGSLEGKKVINCHLGNGSSLAAIQDGKVVDTSMGFTPLDGFLMGTRCGGIDPSVVTFIMKKEGLNPDQMSDLMNKKSGFLGISGVSSDCRDLNEAAKNGNERAQLALDTFCYKVKKYIGAYAAALGGVDAIVFTAGVGENDRGVREKVLSGLEYLGVDVDFDFNNSCPRGEEVEISKPTSRVKVFVIPTDEEMMIARDTAALTAK